MSIDPDSDFAFRPGDISVREMAPIDFAWLRDFFDEAAADPLHGWQGLPGPLDSGLKGSTSIGRIESPSDIGAMLEPFGAWAGAVENGLSDHLDAALEATSGDSSGIFDSLVGADLQDQPVNAVGPFNSFGLLGTDGEEPVDPVGPFNPFGLLGTDSEEPVEPWAPWGMLNGGDPISGGSLQGSGDLLV